MNNVENLHYICKVSSADETSFSESQKVIETIKGSIPNFQSYASRDVQRVWNSCLVCKASSSETLIPFLQVNVSLIAYTVELG